MIAELAGGILIPQMRKFDLDRDPRYGGEERIAANETTE